MELINKIITNKKLESFLLSRSLMNQYLKNSNSLIEGNLGKIDFKLRKPKKDGIYSFRINKQYRAFGIFIEKGIFKVYEINDHSNY